MKDITVKHINNIVSAIRFAIKLGTVEKGAGDILITSIEELKKMEKD